jgi:eukaryotic-like serine/threonine-protein kinase
MPLSPGDKLGHYEVLSLLGVGGMGEVYRANDTKLDRQVAIKVLPSALARDAERLARFQREAKVLASLDHPNIGHIHGLVDAEDSRALVLALIEGPTLADRIAAGPIPLDEAIAVAKQIVEALEYAHDRGVVHRDLKPANVKITPEGVVKVLDFGLAKVLEDEPPASSLANSPTLTMGRTRAGVILGTAAYMSPEQAVGRPVDRRSDIFSFGAVLYEMLTGASAFAGATTPDVLEAVVKDDPDWSKLPAGASGAMCQLLRRCLVKDRKQRLQAIGEARIVLSGPMDEAVAVGAAATARLRLGRLGWVAAAVMTLAACGVAAFFESRPAPAMLPAQFIVSAPAGMNLDSPVTGQALSPDGRFLAFRAAQGEKRFLYLRPLNALDAQPLPGTDNANFPFWSPDSKSIGFFADGKLKRVEISGGSPVTLCESSEAAGAWNRNGVILIGAGGSSYRVPASGGVPVRLGNLAAAFPQFLPDGNHFLYLDSRETEIYVSSLDHAQDRVPVMKVGLKAVYTPPLGREPGRLLFMRDTTLMAQPFNAGKLQLEGEPTPVAESIGTKPNQLAAAFWASDAGLLMYSSSNSTVNRSNLVWIHRSGKRLGGAGPEDDYSSLRLSPDGTRAAIGRRNRERLDDIWVFEFTRGIMSRLTFDPKRETWPVWSPDGRQIAFSANGSGIYQLYRKSADGSGNEEQLTQGGSNKELTDWSRDGRLLVYQEPDPKTGEDIWALPLEGNRKSMPIVQTPFNDGAGQLSPDGKWIAYHSNESGHFEIYMQTFPPSRGRWQISTAGGGSPRWRADGKEIFYLTEDRERVMAVDIRASPGKVEAGVPHALFPASLSGPNILYPYDVTPDGQRFLIQEPLPQTGAGAATFTILMNWQAGLRKGS